MTRKNVFLTAFLMGFAAPALGQIIIPPTVVWVGPEDECDFTSIQEWLDQPPCPFCPPPLGGLQLRLSDNYQHSGNFEINSSVSIIGGFPACGEPSVLGNRKFLSSTALGPLITLHGPINNPIRVTLGGLDLVGSNSTSPLGGVLKLEGGVNLELQNTHVRAGRAIQGGGVAITGDNNRLTITFDSEIRNNHVVQDGGGIWCEDGGVIDFQEGSISANSANTRGGGIGLNDCVLTGLALNKTRRVTDNQVTRNAVPSDPDEPGLGGGIYVRGANARVELGGILTRTRIENNAVDHKTGDPPDLMHVSGGGLHAEESARVILRNVEFFDNQAPHGGGLSVNDAMVDIDRTSGPCLASRDSECSAFIGNKASNFEEAALNLHGTGAAILAAGAKPLTVRRSTFRENESFPAHGLAGPFGSLIETTGDFNGRIVFAQNLAFINDLDGSTGNYYFHLRTLGTAGVRFLQNTVAFNESVAALLRFGEDAPFEAVGNILWEPDTGKMSFQDVPAALSACNVLEKSLPAAVNQSNTTEDPGFVDFSTADFHLAPGSPAVNRCDDRDGRLTAGFDIEGRARPSSNGGNPLLGNYDSGAFEFHSQPPDEVDLLLNLIETSDPDESGATFEARLTNVGLTTAAFGNFNIRFVKPAGGYEEVGGNWSCAEQNVGGTIEVECSTFISSGLATSITTVPLVVEVNPDPADGTCTMNMRADSGSQPDTVPDNDARTLTMIDCDADGVVPDGIFDDRFEQ